MTPIDGPRAALIFERQWLHAAALLVLLAILALASGADAVRTGHWWLFDTPAWFWSAVVLAVVHQVYVWLCWRTQLHGALLTRVFGDHAFTLYAAGFSVLGITRVLAVFALAAANRDALVVAPVAMKGLAVVALVAAVYLFYSVKRYFGFRRAFGIDHFDPAYRSQPFVREGIFRYTRNGMYVYGFLLLWAPALWFASPAALVVAGFNHLYIWVHYHATERPDMNRIYGRSIVGAGGPG